MYQTLAHLRYPTHNIHIACDEVSTNIQCFKYNDRTCDQEVFTMDNLDLLSQYMIEPLPTMRWGFMEDQD
jgi:hypothetical protein